MRTADGRYVLVYNGEVYNFAEIRRELESLGDTFVSTGDSEVVLKACARWGEEAPARFRGMFALAFWDDRLRALLLARDRLGIKPLYVVQGSKGLAFGSEVRALLAAGAARRVLSPRGLLGFMRFGSVQEPDTLLEGVRSIAPGSMLVYSDGVVREKQFWGLPNSHSPEPSREEAVRTIRSLLHESVRLRLVSDVPFGIFLSGGGDSSALAALAAAESSRRVHTFTVVFDEKAYSEERWAADIADRFGCIHHSVRVTGESAAADFLEALYGQDQPSADGLNTWLVSRAARREGLAMALSGLGGDEVFAGYPNFRRFASLVRVSALCGRAPSTARAAMAHWAGRSATSSRGRKALAVLDSAGRPERVYAALRALFTDGQIGALMPDTAYRQVARADLGLLEPESVGDAVNALSRMELRGYLRNTLLRDTDAMSMANSMEIRVPFLDHRLLEYVLSLPGRMKLRGEGNKALLFESVPELPRAVGLRPKMGFVLPIEAWFRGPMREPMEQLLLGLAGPAAGILKAGAIESLWRAFLAGDGSVSASRLFGLASLSSWVSRHKLDLPR